MGNVCWESDCRREPALKTPRVDVPVPEEEKMDVTDNTGNNLPSTAQNVHSIRVRPPLPRGRSRWSAKHSTLSRTPSKDAASANLPSANLLPNKVRSLGQHAFALQKRQCISRLEHLDSTEESKSPATTQSAGVYQRTPSSKFRVAIANFRGEKRGTVEERYQTLGTIGRGAFGEVKKIKERTTGETRALKVCPKARGQVVKEDITDEIAILRRLVSSSSQRPGSPKRRSVLRVLSRRNSILPCDRVCLHLSAGIVKAVTCLPSWPKSAF
jgi:hypothetical protein